MPAKRPLKITDTTLRDGHQSALATRLRLRDMEPVAELLDSVGFHSLEVWGGATFDVAHRFLGEDPWDRLRWMKTRVQKTPLQMLLRGQNLVGYRNYADDVVRAFCHHAVECGMDIFRVFDALNDPRNCEASFKALQETGAHIQATICFSLTERRVGGEVFHLDYYRRKAKEFVELGAHSLCLKDMAGILSPDDAYLLVRELKKIVKVPLHLHTHYTAGTGGIAYWKAIEAGVDVIDCALAPFALRTSQPAVEPFVAALAGTPRDTGLDLNVLAKAGDLIEQVAPKYRHFLDASRMAVIDTGVLRHQIPGGMISNLVNQLKQADALDRLPEVYAELPRTRADLGYPPLVTPTSQIVGVQAVMNVLGRHRYEMVSQEVKDYCFGLYGRPPAPINKKVQAKVLKGYERGEKPITCRPADVLEPEMDKAAEAVKDLAKGVGDVLLYALYPRTGLAFLRYKYGLDPQPPGEPAKTLEDVQREDALIKKALSGELTTKTDAADLKNTRTYRVAVDGEVFEVAVELTPPVPGPASRPAAPPPSAPSPKPMPTPQQSNLKPGRHSGIRRVQTMDENESSGTSVLAPMPGTVVRYLVAVGETVKKGQTVVILEAMKMENALPAPTAGTVVSLGPPPGANVKRGESLVTLE